ncbi:uncharacterized protein LOC128883085 isoform X2 [Hylaeus volcanicus]|uniref:uncharacterized protein LOC128883085 isoform X2 n=1 Tax=Hylaeus volcanicus TaxID=313075 RepID=UPI0023B860B3|nr:uncharacterized protein LOC128883085 isoform X2 [Hylaeus volcanicus]
MNYLYANTVCDSEKVFEESDNYDVEAACIPLHQHKQVILYPACLISGTMLRGGTCGQWLTVVIDFVSLDFSYTPPQKEQYIMRAAILTSLSEVDGTHNETEVEEVELTPCSWFVGNKKRQRVSAGKYSLLFFCRPKKKQLSTWPKNYTKLIGQGEYVINLTPGPAYGEMCSLNRGEYEDEKYVILCETNIEQSILLFTKDIYGNNCTTGDAKVSCIGIGNVQVTSVMNRQNGEYELRFITKSKDTALKITINGHLMEKGCIYLRNVSSKTRKINSTVVFSPQMSRPQLERFLLEFSSRMSKHFTFDPSSLHDGAIQNHILKNGSFPAQLNKLACCQETLRFMYQTIKRLLNVKDPRAVKNIHDKALDDETLMSSSNELEKLREEIVCEEKHVETMFYKIIHDDSIETALFFNPTDTEGKLQSHEEKKDFLQKLEATLEDRLIDLKTRLDLYCKKRESLTKRICETIDSNVSHLKRQERAYALLQKKILKAQLVTKKKQKRREDLGGSTLPAIIAQQANSMRDDMIEHVRTYQVQNRLPIVAEGKEETYKPQRFLQSSSSNFPSDPKSPAFWIAKGSLQKHLKRPSTERILPTNNTKMFIVQNYCRGLEQNFFL